MDKIRAFIENIVYYNEENYYAVLSASLEGADEIILVGHFPMITAGETIEAEGDYVSHPVYGEQFSVSSFSIVPPEGADAIERYLAGGAIKGIGPALAKRIVKKFKADTFRIIEEEPERLSEVKGISDTMAMLISEQFEAKRGMREAVMFMQDYGISAALANRIYESYGPALYTILEKNPYRLAEDLEGIGFRTADAIALKMGIPKDSSYRVSCGITYALSQAAGEGHTWLPMPLLARRSAELLELPEVDLDRYLMDLQINGRIVMTGTDPVSVYLSSFYFAERNAAEQLKMLAVRGESDPDFVEKRIRKIEKQEGIELDELQRDAVRAAVDNGVLVITGGPGTGKTTTINTLIRFFQEDHDTIALAAPTGRAAKRMTEATGCEAKTIHRLLEYTGAPEGKFLRNEQDPLEADVVIVDEMSMVDIFLMEALLKAIVPGTRLILVGDSSQLPSVGPGNVLKDIIRSEKYPTVCLKHIFRQAAESDIIMNAHHINNGEPVDLTRKSRDFLFIKGSTPDSILASVRTLITQKLPGYLGCKPLELQVLTATRKGALGVETLNAELQAFLNPPSADKPEMKIGTLNFRYGDKVMQVKNDYDLEWRRYDSDGNVMEYGTGVFNGDIGRITEIDRYADTLTVLFDDDRLVVYDSKQRLNLELAYAVTVHKSQGSEYPAVIMPMFRGPHVLLNRNLLYTAVTRAKQCVVMVGDPRVFEEMKNNENENQRFSGLCDRICEGYDLSGEMPDLQEPDTDFLQNSFLFPE